MTNKLSFSSYIEKVKKTYSFKLRIAKELDSTEISSAKKSLEQYGVSIFKKTKSLPTQNSQEFSGLGPVEISCFDIETDYPASSEQIKVAIVASGVASLSCVKCYTTKEFELFIQNYVEQPTQEIEPEKFQLIKDLEPGKFKISGEKTKSAKTSSDFSQQNKSPIDGK